MHRVGQPQPHAPRLLLLVRSAIQLSESAERAYFVVDEFTQAAINYWLEVGDTLRNAAISEDIETALIFDGLAERADDIVVCLGELGENAEEPPSPRSAKEM
ncbi:hypothetical protein CspHIS471_0308780 [Cutaneotrichosporon sp. HIS471]|nr:hypothetical protein CspHIS471_0308780 [Cutaneotrichosporon sp. HIS471]